ncbi:MAG: valine--tRNA ligase [Solirubrobacteraceae bacterium]
MSDWAQRTRYEPAEAEPRILTQWLEAGFHHPEPEGTALQNYSIAIPPPNVTGALHMGHALNGSVQDTLIRYHRMLGRRTKWILGTDHAGIATQTQVERLLLSENTSRAELGREKFVERTWEWRAQYGGQIIEQFKRLGATLDYDDERFTLDDNYVRAVLKVFVDLYEKGLIYRDNYMVNWDPGTRSAISDLEVEERVVTDTLYSIDYPLESGSGSVTIATVRPETMLGDTAIAVHPDDERYTRLIGEHAILPLVGRRLKIIADPYVKPDFGTGALKVTPAHDPNDFEIGRNHSLEEIGVIGEDGRMTAQAGERWAGQTVMECREALVDALREEGLISRQEPYEHAVPYSHRSGERIEPLISLQWFMRMDELAAAAAEPVRDGRVRILPEGQRKRYLDWLDNIRPWCISRQLWWGHQIPVYYRSDDERYVGTIPPEGDGWRQDPDVLDTWFSSALWPFATLGWPDDTAALRAFYPTNVLSTGRDILFLWVARMMMMGIEFAGDVPFHDVYVHSVVQAPDGRRMSKSLGTGIDPLDLIDAHGADATRFGMLAMSSTQDVRFNEDKIAQGAALVQKLYSASRLVITRANGDVASREELATSEGRNSSSLALEDRWILSRLARAKEETARAIEAYEFHNAALGLYAFVYGDLCDWYLEIVKPRLETEGGVALRVLRETLAMAHPVIPFVTEEIWANMTGSEGLLAEARWPAPETTVVDPGVEAEMAGAIEVIRGVRAWRDARNVRPGATLPARLTGHEQTAGLIGRLARLQWTADGEPVARAGAVEFLPTDDVDFDAEAREARAQADKVRGEIARAEGKLANEKFVANAPEAVVQKERDKLAALKAELDDLVARAG